MCDLIENDRASIRRFKTTRLCLNRAGERAALITKELSFEQLARKRRAIYLDERMRCAS